MMSRTCLSVLIIRSDVRADAPKTLSSITIVFVYLNPQRDCSAGKFYRNCCDNDGQAGGHAWTNNAMKSSRRSYASFYTSPL